MHILMSENIGYYCGNGKLLLNRTLGKKDAASPLSYSTEEFFYDSYETQKTKTDSLGNTTVTMYDGLGREISFQDEFDNKRITEYNIRSDEPGIRAVSYFKASGSNVKENKVEYIYDRWQRLVSEKRYLTDAEYSEIKYSYDVWGNFLEKAKH